MAEPALLDPSPFDLRHYPAHLFDPDLPLAAGGLPLGEFAGDDGCDGLEFDLPVDFSIDDFLLRSPDRGDDGDDSGELVDETQHNTSSACEPAWERKIFLYWLAINFFSLPPSTSLPSSSINFLILFLLLSEAAAWKNFVF